MNNFMDNFNSQYSHIVKYGTYYFPAWKHYNYGADVVCDKCLTHNLTACIGYLDQDLCLQCVNDIIDTNTFTNRPVCKCCLTIRKPNLEPRFDPMLELKMEPIANNRHKDIRHAPGKCKICDSVGNKNKINTDLSDVCDTVKLIKKDDEI